MGYDTIGAIFFTYIFIKIISTFCILGVYYLRIRKTKHLMLLIQQLRFKSQKPMDNVLWMGVPNINPNM